MIILNIWWWKHEYDDILYHIISNDDANIFLGEGIQNGERDGGSEKKVWEGQGEDENVSETYKP